MITLIAAITRNRGLGRGGDMLYHLSADLKRFKALTMGHPIVMGRKTFESFPRGPLPGRRNIVVTRNAAYQCDGIELAMSLSEAIELAASGDAFVLGGGEIYRQAMPQADRLVMTEIDAPGDGADTFFPEINAEDWAVESMGEWQRDDRSGVRYRYVDYVRRSKGA